MKTKFFVISSVIALFFLLAGNQNTYAQDQCPGRTITVGQFGNCSGGSVAGASVTVYVKSDNSVACSGFTGVTGTFICNMCNGITYKIIAEYDGHRGCIIWTPDATHYNVTVCLGYDCAGE